MEGSRLISSSASAAPFQRRTVSGESEEECGDLFSSLVDGYLTKSACARIDRIVKVVGHGEAAPVVAEVGRMIVPPDARIVINKTLRESSCLMMIGPL